MNTKIKIERVISIKAFDNILQQKSAKVSDEKVRKTKQNFNFVFKMIKSIIYSKVRQEGDILSSEQTCKMITMYIEQVIHNELKECLNKVSFNVVPEAEAHVLNSYQKLAYDSQRRKEIYNKVKNLPEDDLEKIIVTNNIEENEEAIVRSIVYSYRKTLGRLSEKAYKLASAYKKGNKTRQKIKNNLSEKDFKTLQIQASIIGKEEEKFEEWFQKVRMKYSNNIRGKYIETLKQLGEILKKYNFLEHYQNREQKRLHELGIELGKNDINIEMCFDKSFLSQLPLETLMAMNVFWSNRLTKEIESINEVVFILNDLGLIEDIVKDKEIYQQFPFEKISDKDLKIELVKIGVIKEITQMSISQLDKDLEKSGPVEEVATMVELREYLEPVLDKYGEEYEKYFEAMIPKTGNILSEDIENKYLTGLNVVNNLYKCKDSNVLALFEACMTRNSIQNWGYIEDDSSAIGNFVILGFDIPNLNMPLRIHMPKREITNFLKANNMENMIPIYKGSDDFRKFGDFVKTPVLMPMTSEERRQIREIGVDSKKGVQKAMYLEHLKYLADAKTETFPQRLKTPRVIGKGKKQKVKYVLEKEYIDLDTKVKYRKEKDGTYVEVERGKGER